MQETKQMPVLGDRVTIYPAEGRRVRHPHTAMVIPGTGQAVSWAPYWRRRLTQGDITLEAPAMSDGDESKALPKQAEADDKKKRSGGSK